MRLIDADELINNIQYNLWDWKSVDGITATTVLKQTITDIKNEPTIDAVPVVRCKDCRYGYHFYDVQNGITDSWVECRNPDGLNHDAPEDGYCYCGERRNDD